MLIVLAMYWLLLMYWMEQWSIPKYSTFFWFVFTETKENNQIHWHIKAVSQSWRNWVDGPLQSHSLPPTRVLWACLWWYSTWRESRLIPDLWSDADRPSSHSASTKQEGSRPHPPNCIINKKCQCWHWRCCKGGDGAECICACVRVCAR